MAGNVRLTPKQIRKRLRNAGVRWYTIADLGEQVGVSDTRISQVLGTKNHPGEGLREEYLANWLENAKRPLGEKTPAKNLHIQDGGITSAEFTQKLEDAGFTWESTRDLARQLGIDPKAVRNCLNEHRSPAHATVDGWITNGLRRKQNGDKPHTKAAKVADGTRLVKSKEILKQFKAAGIEWETLADLARQIGCGHSALTSLLAGTYRGKHVDAVTQAVVDRWIRNVSLPAEKKLWGVEIIDTAPSITVAEAERRLREAGVRWKSYVDLARQLGMANSSVHKTLNQGMVRVNTINKWLRICGAQGSPNTIREGYLSTKQVIEGLKAAGITWKTYADLGKQVGASATHISNALNTTNDKRGGLPPHTLERWISNTSLPDDEKVWGENTKVAGSTTQESTTMNVHEKTERNPHGAGRPPMPKENLLTGPEVEQRLTDAGIHWRTLKGLARQIGHKTTTGVSGAFHHGSTIPTVDRWIRTAHANMVRQGKPLPEQYLPSGGSGRLTGQMVKNKLTDEGVVWVDAADLASQLSLPVEDVENALENGIEVADFDKWRTEIMIAGIVNRKPSVDAPAHGNDMIAKLTKAAALYQEANDIIKSLPKRERKMIRSWSRLLEIGR